MSKLGEVCGHGKLRRQCDECEMADEIASLRRQRDDLLAACRATVPLLNLMLVRSSSGGSRPEADMHQACGDTLGVLRAAISAAEGGAE